MFLFPGVSDVGRPGQPWRAWIWTIYLHSSIHSFVHTFMQHVFPEALSARQYLLLSVILDMPWKTRSKGHPQEGVVFLAT